MLLSHCKKKLRWDKSLRLELSFGYFSWAHHPMARTKMSRCDCQCLPQVFGHCYQPACSTTLITFFFSCRPQCLMWAIFSHYSKDISLWEPGTKLTWRLHNFCPVITNFHVQMIMQAQLDTLSLAVAWGDTEKPWWDMAFLLIMPIIAAGYKRVFDLVTAWVHPCQAHYTILVEVAHKFILFMDGSTDWVCAFIQLNEALSHAPLSNMGHITTMTDGAPSMGACGWLHQLQVHKLLQYKDQVVCPESLNGQMEALQFTFKELPLWDTATPKQTHPQTTADGSAP